jgi:cystathionine beta-lyase family protein involved in aluminum resistance
MKRSIKDQADHMLRIMTVDMSIDLWQTAMCAISAVEEIIEVVRAVADNDIVTPNIIYWEKVKQELETHVSCS